MKAKVLRNIQLLHDKGNMLREPESKFLEDGIFELRTIQGNNIERILYFFYIGNVAVLTNGFTKKQNKTPRKEIELAKQRRDVFVRSRKNG